MLDESLRKTILRLHEQGRGSRAIAKALSVSRGAVKEVIRDGRAEVQQLARAEKAEPYRDQILELYAACKGNLVRVHEELTSAGAELSYQALTGFCRRHGIGHEPVRPAGQYVFKPGEEMQHDTSPHRAVIGGKERAVHTASLVLCFSRMIFMQMYPRFTRFECKLFLTEAIKYFGGACARTMIDNTHVIVASGTGRDMVPAPEMEAFGERLGTEFRAHAVGNANRSARVERPFHDIDNNFLAGRTFTDWDDVNSQALAWCDKANATHRRHLHASPRELFVTERVHLRPLPIHIPDVYLLHHRIVDSEGFVNVQRNRYSVPWQLIGRRMEVRETKDRIEVFDGPRCVASHKRLLEPLDERVIVAEHRPPRKEALFARRAVPVEEKRLGERMARMADYVALLKKRGRGTLRDVRWLLRMVDEYPSDALQSALEVAIRYGMTDLERLDRMVLRRIADDFFPVHREEGATTGKDKEEDDTDDG